MPTVNSLHANLQFTLEEPDSDGKLSFLDMCVTKEINGLYTDWYTKKTDTGVILNYNSVAPNVYKAGAVSGFVHRIFNSTNTWERFTYGMTKAERILRDNQYPLAFIQRIVNDTLSKILIGKQSRRKPVTETTRDTLPVMSLALQYRGPWTTTFASNLKKIIGNCNIY